MESIDPQPDELQRDKPIEPPPLLDYRSKGSANLDSRPRWAERMAAIFAVLIAILSIPIIGDFLQGLDLTPNYPLITAAVITLAFLILIAVGILGELRAKK